MFYLLPIVFFSKATLVNDRLSFQDLNFDVNIDFPPVFGVDSIYNESVCNSGFEKFKEANSTSDIDVLYSKGAHLEKIIFQIIVCDFVLMGSNIFEKLLS